MSYILDNDATYVATKPYVEPIPVPEEIVEAAKLHGVTPGEYLEARESAAEEAARMPVITASRKLTPEERVISEKNLERLRKQEKDAQRHAEYMHAKEVADNALGTGLSLLVPSTYINYGANALGVKPLNFGESLAVDFLTPGIFGALGKAGKVSKLSKLTDKVAGGAADVVPLLDRSTTVGGRFGRYGSNLPSDVIRTGKRASKIAKKVSPAELARLIEEESAIADNAMKAYKVPGFDGETSHQLFLRYENEPSPAKASWYLERYYEYDREATRIQKNYENAMTRRRDYIYGGVGNTVMDDQSPVFIGPDKKSLLIAAGQKNAKPGELKMITHFAPETLRGGAETVKEALYAQDPIGFAVTDDLAPMLERIGYIKIGNVPQYFNGELVNKTVFVNKATTEKTVNEWLLKKHYIDEPIKIESLQYNISDDYPKLQTYPIKDLIKPYPDKSGAAAAAPPIITPRKTLQRHTYLKPGTLTESKGSVVKLYEPITRTPDGSTSLAFFEKPSKMTIAEKLGIPKGDRGNLNRFQKEALDDLSQYVESGQYRQIPQIQSTGVTWGGTAAESPVNQGIKLGGTARGSDDWLYIRSIPQANGTTISYQPTFNEFGVSAEKLFPEQFGEAVLFRNGIQDGKIKLTAPRTDALPGGGGALQHDLPPGISASHYDYLPNTIDKSIMRPFWETVESTRRPGTYFSGDQGVAPLGANLIQNYTKRLAPRTKVISNGQSQVVGVQGYAPLLEELNRPIKYTTHSDALSTDSYMALLKQGNRPGYSLRFSPDGMETFANVGVQHKNMRDLLLKAQSGEIPKEAFITQFNNWVAPYNGMPAKIVNGEIWMPHPFVYKKQRGGSLNYLNYIK